MALKCKRRPFPIALCGIARIGGCGARNNRFAISEAGNVVPKLRAIPDAGENGQYGIDWLPRTPARTHGEIRIYRVLIDDARVGHREGVTESRDPGTPLTMGAIGSRRDATRGMHVERASSIFDGDHDRYRIACGKGILQGFIKPAVQRAPRI